MFHSKRQRWQVPTECRMLVNNAGTLLSTSLDGYRIAPTVACGTHALLEGGQLVELFPDWPDERFPLHAITPSRHQVSAKMQQFLAFVVGVARAQGEA